MVNGLRANGVTCLEKPSMRGTFIKIASVVVMEFIGGLIGGLGQGVGDVLGQTMAAGKSASARRLEWKEQVEVVAQLLCMYVFMY